MHNAGHPAHAWNHALLLSCAGPKTLCNPGAANRSKGRTWTRVGLQRKDAGQALFFPIGPQPSASDPMLASEKTRPTDKGAMPAAMDMAPPLPVNLLHQDHSIMYAAARPSSQALFQPGTEKCEKPILDLLNQSTSPVAAAQVRLR